ncbi:MAG TPA: hypothetical protein DDY43_08765 [Synechococcales bacterium UBA10510]|nr:hypothetical protein [Synechococcales bacterium UBA10510]
MMRATTAELQQRLLHNPGDPQGWKTLNQLLQEGESTPEPEAKQTMAAAASAAPAPPRQKRVQKQKSVQKTSFDPRTPRPLHSRWTSVGSPEERRLIENQLAELVQQLQAEEPETLIPRLGRDLPAGLVDKLDNPALYALGEACYRQERFELGLPLLQGLIARGEEAGDLLDWARLFAARCQRGSGLLGEARSSFESLAAKDAGESNCEPGFHAQVDLAWLDLNAGNPEAAKERLQILLNSSFCSEHETVLDLLGRVISTLEWLETNPRNQLSHIRDLADSASLVFAADALQLSPCGTLLQLEGWLVDPNRQVSHLCLIRGRRVQWLDLGQAQYRHRGDLAEVLQRCGAPADFDAGLKLAVAYHQEEAVPLDPGEAAELFVVLRNGDQFCLHRPMVAVSFDVPRFKGLLDAAISDRCSVESPGCLVRIREAWSRQMQQRLQRPAQHQRHGTRSKPAELSVVVPLYGRIDFMEYQLNWFNAWLRRLGSNAPGLQLIYVLDDPRLEAEFRALVKRCQTLYRMPFETVINPENLGFAGANNRGVLYATAPYLLLLNSDVLPANDHSLETMLRALQQHPRRVGALGARLLFDNGGIQHVGMEFVKEDDLDGELGRVWLNEHPLKGVNVGFGEQERLELREVEAATAACLLMQTERFRTLGGFSTHYVVGDFEDSDLCLKVRRMGLGIYVDLEACFYHLERQSVGYGEKSDALKMKVVATNALEHHQRWCSTIERLKSGQQVGVQP